LLFFVLILTPRGFFKERVNFSFDDKGNSAVEVSLDPPFYQKDLSPLSLLKTSILKNDYLFIVYYHFNLEGDLSLPQSPRPVYLVLSLPGSIIESNADRIEEGKAYWLLTGVRKKSISLKTRYVRWWYILLFLLGFSYIFWWWLRGRERTVAV
jgi:hypothetical protein